MVKNEHDANKVVNEIRTFLESMIRSHEDQDCPVCYVIRGIRNTNHASGPDCPQMLCNMGDSEWEGFQKGVRFPKSHGICWYCYLPTVST